MSEGDSYGKILKSVTINILDYKLLNNSRVHNSYVFKEKDTDDVLTDLAEIHFLELPKLTGRNYDNLLEDWLLFIENPESEEIDMLAKKIPEINEAKNVLKVLSLDKKSRAIYELRQKALKDKTNALDNAKKKGLEQGLEQGMKKNL